MSDVELAVQGRSGWEFTEGAPKDVGVSAQLYFERIDRGARLSWGHLIWKELLIIRLMDL